MITLWAAFLAIGTTFNSSVEAPIEVKFEKVDAAVVVKIQLDGEERRVALSALLPTSYLAAAGEGKADVALGGKTIARVQRTASRSEYYPRVDGVLGIDVLKDMAIGVDVTDSRITIWPKGTIGDDEAKAWAARYPAWERAAGKVAVVQAQRDGAALTVPIGTRSQRALLELEFNGTALGAGWFADEAVAVRTTDRLLTSELRLGGRDLPWISFLRGTDPMWSVYPSASEATVTLEAFRSRRVLIDFSAGRVYHEELPADALLTFVLTEWFGVPYNVKGDTLWIESMPGVPWPSLGEFSGSEVLELAEVKTPELLQLLRSRRREDRTRVADILGSRIGHEAWIRMPDGREFMMKPQTGRSGGSGSKALSRRRR